MEFVMKKKDVLSNPKLLSAYVSRLFSLAGPRLGSFLVEPQVLMTLAGMRGLGRIMIGVSPDERFEITNEIRRKVNVLNKELCAVESRIRFSTQGNPVRLERSGICLWYVPVEVQNLDGFTESFFQWMQATGETMFDISVCEKVGLASQMKRLVNIFISHLRATKKISRKHSSVFSRLCVVAGVPFQAAMDQVTRYSGSLGSDLEPCMVSSIDVSQYRVHVDCDPNFFFFEKNASDSHILECIADSNTILSRFYEDPAHSGIKNSRLFSVVRKFQEEWLART